MRRNSSGRDGRDYVHHQRKTSMAVSMSSGHDHGHKAFCSGRMPNRKDNVIKKGIQFSESAHVEHQWSLTVSGKTYDDFRREQWAILVEASVA